MNINKYLEDPEILLNHKIHINLNYNKVECIEQFGEFLKECMMTNRFPQFYDIGLPSQLSTAFFIKPLYETLQLMDEGKEKYLVSHCKFLSTRYILKDCFLNKPIDNLMNTEYTNNIDVFCTTEGYKSTVYFYSQFKISKFNVKHIDFEIQNEDALIFLNSLPANDEIKKEFSLITSTRIPYFYHQTLNEMEKFKRLHCIFPNLKRVELKMNLHNAIGTLQYIRDNRIDIFVNLDSLSNYNYCNVNINNFKIQENSIVHTTCKNKTSNNLIAYRVSMNGKFKFYSFDSGFFELWSYSMFNADGGYCIMTRIYEINLNNVKMLSDDENEEIKLDEYSNDFLDLKMYIENLNVVYNYPCLIFPNKNISKIGTNINQKYDESLVKAKKFEFFINENIINGFKSEGTLIEAVPDYISLGYDRSNTSFQSLGSQITLTIKISKITKKTLSIFWHLKNKNLQNLICYCQIPRSKSLCTKSEVTLLCIIRKLNTLKSLTLTLLDQNSKASSYIFKNLTPTRLQLIIDSVFGHDPSLPALEELSEPIDMRSLMLITDSISVIE